jgi:hypothetical protein
MNEEDIPAFLGKFKELVASHPAVPTDKLHMLLVQCVALHEGVEEADKLPSLEVMPCAVIAIVRELLMYRDRYGLIELPYEDWTYETGD